MSAKIITDISRIKPDVSARVWDLYVDGNAYGITGGSITPGPPNTFFRTTNLSVTQWDPFTLQYIPSGVTGTILRSGVTGVTGSIHWGFIENSDIRPGASNQLFVTNTAGNGVQWASNILIPGTLGVTGASTFTGNGLFRGDLAVNNDMNIINGDLAVGNGQLQVLLGSSTLQDTDIGGNLTFNSSSGVTGNVLVKTSASDQNWGLVPTSGITPGVINQVFTTNGVNNYWSSDIDLPGLFNVTGAATFQSSIIGVGPSFLSGATTLNTLTTSGLATLASENLIGNLQFNSNSGSVGQVIVKTGAASQNWSTLTPSLINPGSNNQALFTRSGNVTFSNILPSDITTGTANQFLVKDISGTSTIFTSNPVVPGNLSVNGTTTTTGTITANGTTNIVGNLQFNSSSGSTGNYLVKTGTNTQTWQAPPNVKLVRYTTYLASQDLNAGAGPTPVSFDNVNVISAINLGSVASVAGISQPSTTTFTIGNAGTYDIDITGFCSGAGIGNSYFLLSVEVNGVELPRCCISNSMSYSFSGKFPSIPMSAGATLRILTRRGTGSGSNALNTNPSPPSVPNFASTIAISLVNTL